MISELSPGPGHRTTQQFLLQFSSLLKVGPKMLGVIFTLTFALPFAEAFSFALLWAIGHKMRCASAYAAHLWMWAVGGNMARGAAIVAIETS